MQELSTPPQATFTFRGNPRTAAASSVKVPRISVDGTISGNSDRGNPVSSINSSSYAHALKLYAPGREADCEFVEGETPEEKAAALVRRLREERIL